MFWKFMMLFSHVSAIGLWFMAWKVQEFGFGAAGLAMFIAGFIWVACYDAAGGE